MATAGIIIPLKMALPAVVPIPKAKLSTSPKSIKLNKVVNNSGIELPTALMVAPRTPSVRLRPKYSEATSKPSLDRQMINIAKVMAKSAESVIIVCRISNKTTPKFCFLKHFPPEAKSKNLYIRKHGIFLDQYCRLWHPLRASRNGLQCYS